MKQYQTGLVYARSFVKCPSSPSDKTMAIMNAPVSDCLIYKTKQNVDCEDPKIRKINVISSYIGSTSILQYFSSV